MPKPGEEAPPVPESLKDVPLKPWPKGGIDVKNVRGATPDSPAPGPATFSEGAAPRHWFGRYGTSRGWFVDADDYAEVWRHLDTACRALSKVVQIAEKQQQHDDTGALDMLSTLALDALAEIGREDAARLDRSAESGEAGHE